MQAGFGRTEITPPLGVELAGYGYYLQRKAETVRDPLFARALAIENEKDTYLLVSCDCLGLSLEITDQVRAHLAKSKGIPAAHIIIVSIHTHTGPAMKYHEGCGAVSPEYTAGVPEKIIDACEKALADVKPVEKLEFIQQTVAQPIAYNRAYKENPVDDQARFFRLQRRDALPIILASYACHAVCRGAIREVSADYPGVVCEKLGKQGAQVMYLNGLCGDIDPIRCLPEERNARIERFAKTICEAVNGQRHELPLTVFGTQIDESVRVLQVTKEDIHRIADAAAAHETNPPGGARVARVWEKEMLEGFDQLTDEERFPVRCLFLGGVPIIALPFEGYTLTGMLIREQLKDQRALVLGCADQLMGYLPTEDDIERHSYAAQDASFLYKRLPSRRGEAERIGREVGRKLSEIDFGGNKQ